MKYYYLIDNKIMSALTKMPPNDPSYKHNEFHIKVWLNSLQPCEISESELMKIYTHLSIVVTDVCLRDYIKNPIEVTDIVESDTKWSKEQDCVIDIVKFKQPKQVEEIEAVELMKYLDECIESCNKRLNEFKTGKMDYSYYGSMAMMSAYNNVKQFIKERNNGK